MVAKFGVAEESNKAPKSQAPDEIGPEAESESLRDWIDELKTDVRWEFSDFNDLANT